MVLRAHRIRLIPTAQQVAYCNRAAGIERYAHNWGLNVAEAYFVLNGETLSDGDLKKLWNAHRKAALPWTYEVTKHAGDSGMTNFCSARRNWFGDIKERKKNPRHKTHFRKPRLKTKRRSKKSFTMYEIGKSGLRVNGDRLIVPKLGAVRMTESVRFPGNIKHVTISEQGGHWFASFLVELSVDYVYPHRCETQTVVGIDLGLNAQLTLSTGEKLPNPKFYRRLERKLKRDHRALSRKQKGSRNREKARRRLNENYARLGNHRTDHLHQITTPVVRQFLWIGVEDLAVANLMKNHSLAAALADASFGEIRRQLQYKTAWAGSHLVVAARFYPSSKLCSVCGYKHDALQLSDREWTCPRCGTYHDRDVNASQNLESVARGSRDTQNACVTAPPETERRRSRGKTRGSKDSRAAAAIQECRASSTSVGEL
jgi:putative transposase